MKIASAKEFPLQLTQSHLPSIRRLSLSGVNLKWTSWPLPGLTSLSLANVTHSRGDVHTDVDGGELDALLDALEACISLETFEYEKSLPSESDPPIGMNGLPDKRVVALPSIRKFSVDTVSVGDAAVLAHVTLPRDAVVEGQVHKLDFTPSANEPVLAAVLPSNAASLPVLTHARKVTVWLTDRALSFVADENLQFLFTTQPEQPEDRIDPYPALTMHFHTLGTQDRGEDMFRSAIRELANIFPPCLDSLIIKGPIHLVDTESWTRVLAAFPLLENFSLYSSLDDFKGFVKTFKPKEHATPCPRLRTLRLVAECSRAGRAEPDSDDAVTAHVAMLHELRGILQERCEADSRLAYLHVDLTQCVDCIAESTSAPGSEDSESESAPDPLLAALREIWPELNSVVEALYINY
ncbi:hypothetical protein FOMPIDRAFT_1049991 [Fomitopsis schrenkii]|uniref:Uncharacterized protein n=1 Tax=Fomitopsis schrenkii TaxID=2126942 RepID=S8FPE8_FOMSC|nr:hypothetical protein FOMPIDRAFT_1049991 [Fomitopsis schrenkii]